MPRTKRPLYNSDETQFGGGDEEIETCRICHQEFTGLCSLNSARCPYIDQVEDKDDEDEEEEADTADFDDVEKLDEILAEDVEAEKKIDEAGDMPPEAMEGE
jgi:hypothetical protein